MFSIKLLNLWHYGLPVSFPGEIKTNYLFIMSTYRSIEKKLQ